MRHTIRLMALALFIVMDLTHPVLATLSGTGDGSSEGGRTAISRQLMGLAYSEGEAREMAAALTADDLAVLLENPRMMQRAGSEEAHVFNYVLCAVAICAAIYLYIVHGPTSDAGGMLLRLG